MCGNFALWYVICFRRGDQWSPFLVHSIISVLFSVGAAPTMSIFLELFRMTVFWIKPPLRLSGTSPQGEAFEGSCRQSRLRGHKIFTYQQRNVDCIVKYRNVLKITQKKRRPTVAPTLPKNYSSPSSIASLCESDILPVFLSTSITLTFSQSPSLTTSSTISTL